ncbi:hypothetical protein [Blastococcus sp. URHD0036]|nr:hypothetical protein [Blastococcus sp. URHD0036]
MPFVTPIAFEEIGDGIERLERDHVPGRLIAVQSSLGLTGADVGTGLSLR